MIRVLSVAAEAYPLIKTGGLGDVVGALPKALSDYGVAVTTLLPGYPSILSYIGDAPYVHHFDNLLGVEARILSSHINGHPLLILDAPTLFNRDGGIYGDGHGTEWPDNWRRFAALGRAAADLASGVVANWRFDLLHAHDWHAGLAPAYLRYAPGPETPAPSLLTIHNMAFQGRFDISIFPLLGLPPSAYNIEGVEYYGGVGFLKAGLASADAITTVSDGYAKQIQQPAFGLGLEGLVRARAADLSGIPNGIDPDVWNPRSDPALAMRYDMNALAARRANKRAIEGGFGLAPGDGPLFTAISRLSWQKGMDVLIDTIDELVALGGRLAILGTGERNLEDQFRFAAMRYPGQVAVALGYDEKLAHLLQGGADAILIPSRFEPCGLTQLYGLSYGCVPVATRTGGLGDTIIDANEAALIGNVATGILFDGATKEQLASALERAVSLYHRPELWHGLQVQGMKSDVSWHKSGARYFELYNGLLGSRRAANVISSV